MSELCSMPVNAMVDALVAREISSVELVQAHLQRIEAVNPDINAVVVLTAEQALSQAEQADKTLSKGHARRPLLGVPVTIKDCFDTAGIVTTSGTLGRAGNIPDRDATAVARLKDAGAIVIGKTNCPEFCFAFETDNLVYGRTVNPYNHNHVPGGSSGGEGAIIAAGGSPLGLASDGAGSIRVPAHCNGIAGLKPTTGRVPTTGYWPPLPAHLAPTNAVGVMARSIYDLGLGLTVIAGVDDRDPAAVPMPNPGADTIELQELRLATFSDNGAARADSVTAAVVAAAADALSDAGCAIQERYPACMKDAPELFVDLYAVDQGESIRRNLKSASTVEVHPLLSGLLEIVAARSISGLEAETIIKRWHDFQSEMLEFMRDFDAIICPVNAMPALRHGETFSHLPAFSFTYSFNFTGWPALAVRAGTSPDGLPIGIQVVAKSWREDIVLTIGQYLEQAFGGWSAPTLT